MEVNTDVSFKTIYIEEKPLKSNVKQMDIVIKCFVWSDFTVHVASITTVGKQAQISAYFK